MARRQGYRTIISAARASEDHDHRRPSPSATAAGQIKIGSVARSERLAKYNRLLRIGTTSAPGPASPAVPRWGLRPIVG